MNKVKINISDGPSDLSLCRITTEEEARKMGFNGDELGDLVYAVFEACTNAVTHGQNGKDEPATLTIRTYPDRFEAVVKDSGKGFTCPIDTPIPPVTSTSGRGIPLMRAFADEVQFENDGGCRVTMVKHLNQNE